MANTPFAALEDSFLSKITDDMYMELTPEDTEEILDEILVSALFLFEFPRVDIFDYDLENRVFNNELSKEEINIISTYMVVEWIGQQLATIDLIKQKYSGSDFKFTSQAAHIKQLLALKEQYTELGFHLQRVYCRRKLKEDGGYGSTFSKIMEI